MVSEKDILRTAQATIHKCGKKYVPLDYVLNQAERLFGNGDAEGAATWMHVANAIGVILSSK